VYKGDGGWLAAHANDHASELSVLHGTGLPRDFACQRADCLASGSLLSIVSMVAGPDGSLYVGDYNLIRRIWPNGGGGSSSGRGGAETIFEFGPQQQSFLYSLAVSPAEEGLYLTNSERYQVWRIPLLSGVERPAENYEVVAGTGDHCVPGLPENCGDGGPAVQARLIFPKVDYFFILLRRV
jgi:teneurin